MKGYYINLNKREDRKKLFLQQGGVIEWERIAGIDTNPGWIGCRESHLKALNFVKDVTLIAEDDCLFMQPWKLLGNALHQLPADWDVLYLGATLTKKLEQYSKNLYHLQGGYSNTAIIYRNDIVPKYILEHRDEIIRYDKFMVSKVQPQFKCFIINPIFACQRPGYSDIMHKRFDNGLKQRKRFLKYAKG